MAERKVIAVDLDGTLAKYDDWQGIAHIGDAVPGMLRRVKMWIRQGHKVVIFTSRAEKQEAVPYVKHWLSQNGLDGLEVTNKKSSQFSEIYDDRARQVVSNKGVLVTR